MSDKVESVNTDKYVYLDGYADAGETEAMLLYKQINADWLLIDDKRGKKIAVVNNIKTIGSLGVLLTAKKRGLINELKPKLEQLTRSDLYLSESLINTILELAEE